MVKHKIVSIKALSCLYYQTETMQFVSCTSSPQKLSSLTSAFSRPRFALIAVVNIILLDD